MVDGKEKAAIDRARPRRKLFQPAELDTAAGPQRIHLLDLSETGALINGVSPPIAGSFVSLVFGTFRRSAKVAWVRGQRYGVTFVMPLTATQIDAVLELGAGGKAAK